MHDAHSETTPNTIPEGGRSTSNVIYALWDRIEKSTLTERELKWFAGASNDAGAILDNLRTTIDGVTVLVNDEAQKTGVFETKHDLPGLLFAISSSVDCARGLLHVSSEAAGMLIHENHR